MTPDEWAQIEEPSWNPIGTLLHGELGWTASTADPLVVCAVRVTGAANVLAERNGRILDAIRIRSVVGDLEHLKVPLAAGPDADCRPATYYRYCPDAAHLPAADCPEGEPAWHVYIQDYFTQEPGPNREQRYPRDEIEEGELRVFHGESRRPYQGFSEPGTWHWRAAHGRISDGSAVDLKEWRYLDYRAPWVSADVTETLTLTYELDGYCSTTTIEFTVLDAR